MKNLARSKSVPRLQSEERCYSPIIDLLRKAKSDPSTIENPTKTQNEFPFIDLLRKTNSDPSTKENPIKTQHKCPYSLIHTDNSKTLSKDKEPPMHYIYRYMIEQDPSIANILPSHKIAHQSDSFELLLNNIENEKLKNPEVFYLYMDHVGMTHVSRKVTLKQYDLMRNATENLARKQYKGEDEISGITHDYNKLRDIFKNLELVVQKELESRDNYFKGFKDFTVTQIIEENDKVISLYLKPTDGSASPSFSAGHHVAVRSPYYDQNNPEHTSTMRDYSVSNKPGDDYLRLTVKKIQGEHISYFYQDDKEQDLKEIKGGHVSNFLHSRKIGDEIEVNMPNGVFAFNPEIHKENLLILIGQDIKITPLQSILLKALEDKISDREIIFIDINKDEETSIFHKEIDELEKNNNNLTVKHLYTSSLSGNKESQELVTKDLLQSLIPHGYSIQESDCFISSGKDTNYLIDLLVGEGVDSHHIFSGIYQCEFLGDNAKAFQSQCPILGNNAEAFQSQCPI